MPSFDLLVHRTFEIKQSQGAILGRVVRYRLVQNVDRIAQFYDRFSERGMRDFWTCGFGNGSGAIS